MGVSAYNLQEPWTRQPFDTDLTWVWFQLFLTLPRPRSLSALRGADCPLTLRQLQILDFEDGWTARVVAWDQHLDALRFQTIEEVTKEDARARAERQAKIARKMTRLGELELDKLLAVVEKPHTGAGMIAPRDATRMIVMGIRTERLVLGETTEKTESGPDLSGLTIEELRTLRVMQEKAKAA